MFSKDGHANILYLICFSSNRTLTFLPLSGGIYIPPLEHGRNFVIATATTMNRVFQKLPLHALFFHCVLLVHLVSEPSIQAMKELKLSQMEKPHEEAMLTVYLRSQQAPHINCQTTDWRNSRLFQAPTNKSFQVFKFLRLQSQTPCNRTTHLCYALFKFLNNNCLNIIKTFSVGLLHHNTLSEQQRTNKNY